jgi:hypothetical protein
VRIYLAARYSRRLELCEYRSQFEAAGHRVTSRWLNGSHQISDAGNPIGDHGESLLESNGDASEAGAAFMRTHFANEDVTDVRDAELLIAFTEPPRSSASRGGRHVELGMAIGMGKRVIIVGYRENVFCWLPYVEFHESWGHLKQAEWLLGTVRRRPELGAIHQDGGYPQHVPVVTPPLRGQVQADNPVPYAVPNLVEGDIG